MIGSIIGGILGNNAAKGDRAKAAAAIEEATRIIDEVGAPPDLSAKIYYDHLKQAGVITPENEQQIQLGLTAFTQVKEDEKLRDAQISALEQMKQVSSGGLRPEDRAAFNKLRQETAVQTQGKIDQIGQNFAQRGMSGGGNELIAQLSAAQEGANRLSTQGDDIAAAASQRALEALAQSSNMASQARQQDYQKESDLARAKDAFEQFRAQNAQSVQQRNVDRGNEAQLRNLQEAQRIQDFNTQMENQEKLRQEQAKRDYWQDKLSYASARAGARTASVPFYQGQANQKARMWQNIGFGVDQALGAGGSYMAEQDKQSGGGPNAASMAMLMASDINMKENIQPAKDKVEDMLDNLSEYHYNYKQDEQKEPHTGIMAQDLEKSEPGKELVIDTPDGKMVDFSRAGGVLFASLANLNKRLKELEGKK